MKEDMIRLQQELYDVKPVDGDNSYWDKLGYCFKKYVAPFVAAPLIAGNMLLGNIEAQQWTRDEQQWGQGGQQWGGSEAVRQDTHNEYIDHFNAVFYGESIPVYAKIRYPNNPRTGERYVISVEVGFEKESAFGQPYFNKGCFTFAYDDANIKIPDQEMPHNYIHRFTDPENYWKHVFYEKSDIGDIIGWIPIAGTVAGIAKYISPKGPKLPVVFQDENRFDFAYAPFSDSGTNTRIMAKLPVEYEGVTKENIHVNIMVCLSHRGVSSSVPNIEKTFSLDARLNRGQQRSGEMENRRDTIPGDQKVREDISSSFVRLKPMYQADLDRLNVEKNYHPGAADIWWRNIRDENFIMPINGAQFAYLGMFDPDISYNAVVNAGYSTNRINSHPDYLKSGHVILCITNEQNYKALIVDSNDDELNLFVLNIKK